MKLTTSAVTVRPRSRRGGTTYLTDRIGQLRRHWSTGIARSSYDPLGKVPTSPPMTAQFL
jgi:hypothetical protein